MTNTETVQIFKPEANKPDIEITPAASAHILKALKKRGSGVGMRLSLEKSGCTGFSYVVTYVDSAMESDRVYPIGDDKFVYLDSNYFIYLKGIKIDYVREGLNERLKFTNDNETAACGCGESVSF